VTKVLPYFGQGFLFFITIRFQCYLLLEFMSALIVWIHHLAVCLLPAVL